MNGNPTKSRRDWSAMHGVAFVALTIAAFFIPVFRIWPLLWLVPLAAYGALVAAVPPLRATFGPWRFGRISTPTVMAMLIIVVGSCSVLVAFQLFKHPDLRAYRDLLPIATLGGGVMGCLLFSILNALLEELIFRGVLFDAVESQWGVWVAVAATAGLFGYGHMRGYPPGPLGALLAGIYGLCLGWLRVFSGGLGLPVIAHIAADATIFAIVVRSEFF